MKQNFFKFLFGAALACTGLAAKAQGLEGIVVEDYYTITAADASYLSGIGTYPINAGAKVYRIYVDMAPNYKLNTVNGSPLPIGGGPSPNPLDFTTTTTFWNEDGFGSEVPPQTARFDDGASFDSYITIGTTGRSGGAVGCGTNTQQVGTLKTADTNGNLTLCSVYEGFPAGAGTPDGNIPGTVPALTYNLGGLIDFSALTANGSSLVVVGDAWATLPNGTGVDPTGTNRQLIAQLTTDGALSFHINVQLQQPTGGVLETYVWQTAGAGEVVSSLLTYPQAGVPDCLGVIGGTALPGTPCNDNDVCTINDVYTGTAPNCGCAGTPDNTDTDGDGIPNCSDNCPTVVGQIGSTCNDGNACTDNDVLNASCVCTGTLNNTDTDGDGIPNCSDNCPTVVGQIGSTCNDGNACTDNDVLNASCVCVGTLNNTDTDGDGVPNCSDNCPTVAGQIGSTCNDGNACTTGDVLNASCVCAGTLDNTDTDGDGVPNCSDNCPTVAGQIGSTCNDNNACTDNDVLNASCVCAGTLNNADTDGDGVPNCSDNCPTVVGQIGSTCNDNDVCTINDVLNASCACVGTFQDTDGDGTCNANDGCPTDPNKIAAGQCGCGVADTDTDGDGVANCNDNCPTVVGQIGSSCDDGNINTTGDVLNASCVCEGSTVDCNDNDPCTIDSFNGTICVNAPGPDADGDGTCDLIDGCPNDPNKIAAGICGCGVADTDTDGDGTANCNDGCPTDPNKITAGICGCGVADTDTDGDGTANCNDGCPTDPNKIAPGICGCGVADTDTDGDGAADCVDSCPNLIGQVGSVCDDGNINTTGDVINANCVCVGSTVDCNDNDPCTLDSFNGTICVNTPLTDTDGDGTCDLTDGCANDPNKIAPGICGCGNAEPGTACNDNNAGTVGDVINANCVCEGTPLGVDCEGTPGGSALPGTACDDGISTTGQDTWSPNCVCIGLPFDCLGVPGGTATIGSACNDGNVCTTGDVYNASCVCAGTVVDTDGDGVCDANDNCPTVTGQIGSVCDDGNANTGPDALNANCQCVGPIIGGCTENLTLSVKLDGNPTETTWTLLDAATETVTITSGGFNAGQANTTVVVPICVPVGCYHLRVLDSGSNGITNGGYVLRDASSRRIIDASLGSFSSVSQINTGTNPNRSFCVPISNIKMLNNSCDRTNQLIQSPVYCNSQPGANGYQFWIYDAHGTYNRRVTVTNPTLVPSTLLTDPVPTNVNLNIRVRSRIGSTFGEFGPACRIKFIPNNGGSGFRSMEFSDETVASMTIYPNPNRDGQLTISMEGLEIADGANVDVVIYDLLGKPVVTETAPVAEGMLNHRMDLAGRLGQGMYVVNVTIDGKLYTQRLVMQ